MANETIKHGKNGLPNFFRQEAVEALNTLSDQQPVQPPLRPSAWAWLLTCLLLLSSLLIWATYYQVNLTVDAPGIILSTKQIHDAEQEMARILKEKNQRYHDLTELYQSKINLYHSHYLTRVDILRANDERIAALHERLESEKNFAIPFMQDQDDSDTLILAFVDYLHGKRVHPRMRGYASPAFSTYPRIAGTVTGVSLYPVTRPAAYHYLHNANLVDTYLNTGTPFLIKFRINRGNFSDGTPVLVKITYQSCTPLQLVIQSHHCE